MIIPALICGLVFTSCNAEKIDLPSRGLYVIGTKAGGSPNIADLVFTGNDIVSFDEKTVGEIVFVRERIDEIISRAKLYYELHFFINGKPVFSPPIKIHFEDSENFSPMDLHFRISENGLIRLICISYIFKIHWSGDDEGRRYALEFNRRWQKRREQLDVLRNYLK